MGKLLDRDADRAQQLMPQGQACLREAEEASMQVSSICQENADLLPGRELLFSFDVFPQLGQVERANLGCG